MIITNPNYQLPQILAMTKSKNMSSGRTEPMLIRGMNIFDRTKGDYVVKCSGSKEMAQSAPGRELLASFIAKELEIQVVEPALIKISTEFIAAMQNEKEYEVLRLSEGDNYGSRYILGLQTFSYQQKLTEKQKQDALSIFLFDVLIENADRRNNKPNAGSDGEHIYIFDHELAFSYTSLILSPEPWYMTGQNDSFIRDHIFYNSLRGSESHQLEPLLDKFENLNSSFWSKAEELIPKEWNFSSEFNKVRSYTEKVLDNKTTFSDSIRRMLQ